MIVSVPHTGTRTLRRVLGVSTLFHFCQDEANFEQIDECIDFPIRDPLATSLSWRSFQSDRDHLDEFERWEAAIKYLATHEHVIHKMEDYPVLEGQSGKQTWWQRALTDHDLNTLKKLPEVEYLLQWYENPEIREFFEPHYGVFWWQKTESLGS